MDTIQFNLPPQIQGSTQIVGFYDYTLYISPVRANGIEIWNVHTFVPKSFKMMIKLDVQDVEIREFTLSPDGESIYCLFIATFPKHEIPKICVAKINTEITEYKIWELDFDSGDAFEQVYLNNVGLICGEEKLYMFDRTLVMGDIPFWEFNFSDDKETFNITANHIPQHDPSFKCNRYLIMHNPDTREVIKMDGGHDILIFDGSINEWIYYTPDEDNELRLTCVTTRGISEIRVRRGQRFEAIETKLSIFGRENRCIFKISNGGRHTFFRFSLNKENKTYKLKQIQQIHYKSSELSYRIASTDKRIAFVGQKVVAFIIIDPPTLKEIGFWGAQKIFAKKMVNGTWIGGKTEKEVRDEFQIKLQNSLI
uniref:Uncharacterized protein n=1 Tax=Panagrolaimus sp. PS1159 TaxID=55785 RepID=A0AC35GC24_9BILA